MTTAYERLRNMPNMTLLQMLIFGEARGEPIDGMVAVAWVARNRVENPSWWGDTWKNVILKPKQFSCFNENDPNFSRLFDMYAVRFSDPMARLCRWIAGGVIYNWIPNNIGEANHYCHVDILPGWAEGQEPVKIIGHHKFYCL